MTTQRRGSAIEHDFDDWLGHDSRAGDSATFLDSWTDRDPPEVKVLLHMHAKPISVWQSQWPKIITAENDSGEEQIRVYGSNWGCWEYEDVLTRQFFRYDDGTRKSPPTICPLAMTLEEIYLAVARGDIPWNELLFQYDASDTDKSRLLHAGCITGQVKKIWPKLTDKDKRLARDLGVPNGMEQWKYTMMPKCKYVLSVLDYDDVASGIQIAKESVLIGDKIKKLVRDKRSDVGEKGNPMTHPYVFKWSHNPKETDFNKKYDVIALSQLEVTEEMLEHISGDAPDMSRISTPGDIVELRASMEDNYVGPEGLLDWDKLFAPAEEEAGVDSTGSGEGEESGERTPDVRDREEEAPAEDAPAEEEPAGSDEAEPELDPERYRIAKTVGKGDNRQCLASDGVTLFGCEDCGKIMREDEDTCPHCGADYSEGDEETEEELIARIREMSGDDCVFMLADGASGEVEMALLARVVELKPPPPTRRRRTAAAKPTKEAPPPTRTRRAKAGTATQRATKAGKKGPDF